VANSDSNETVPRQLLPRPTLAIACDWNLQRLLPPLRHLIVAADVVRTGRRRESAATKIRRELDRRRPAPRQAGLPVYVAHCLANVLGRSHLAIDRPRYVRAEQRRLVQPKGTR
jgi:hypothetical protein